MKEFKSRVDSYSREMLRKDSQIKELQGRIEVGDGCKYFFSFLNFTEINIFHYIYVSYIIGLLHRNRSESQIWADHKPIETYFCRLF